MQALQIKLLGRFESLSGEGEPISLPMRKAEVLLAFLALAPGLRHPRERLINLLWSDRGEEQARNSLRQCLSSIRKSLGEVAELALQVDRTTVCINAEMIEVDVLEFERLATDADYESLVTAADLYQGEFLEGIAIRDAACQEWLESERARFKRQFVEILYNLAETQLVSHDYRNAIRSAERLVEQDPLTEAGWRLLMQSYADSGDRGHALQAFKRCAQILRQELDVEPEAATVALRDSIATGASSTKSPAVAQPAAPATPKSTHEPTASLPAIAVLPFDNLSGDPEQEYFSDGITDSIIMNLGLFPGLRVKSRNSSFAFKQQIKSLGEISRELGVDYLVEGSVRRSNGRIRVNVQLIEAASGNQVWGKRYDSDLEDLFGLEEDLCRSIAATVTGKIESELQRIALNKGASDQQAYDLLLAGIYHVQRANRNDNAIAIEKLNACLEHDPDNAQAHAWLYDCHHFSVMDRWSNDLDRSRQLAVAHIKRAVELAPEQKSVLLSYIDYLTFEHRYDEAEAQVQRALAINPNEAGAYAARAVNLSSMGQWPEAVVAAEIALRLDPHNYWGMWILAEALFFCDRYGECLETIARTDNAPGFVLVYNIAANIELGRADVAQKSLDAFIDFCGENMLTPPATTDEWRQYFLDNAPFSDSSVNERILKLLIDAGLEKKMADRSSASQKSDPGIPSIAVLPFDNLSGDPEQEYFSDGITESVILNLALFPGLHVKSRNSSFAFKQQLKGLAEISQELDVDYIVEGSIRKSDRRIRITAQLIDAANGNQVWGKRYDSEIDDLFELEENLSREIAATVTGRIESELQRVAIAKGAADQQAYDWLLAGMYHVHRFNATDNKIAIEHFERCLDQDPDNVRANVGLYICYSMAYFGRWLENHRDSIGKARDYIRRALTLDPEDRAAQLFNAEMLNFSGNHDKARQQIDRVLKKNPNDTDALAVLAAIQISMGDFDDAQLSAERALQLDPYHPWAEWEQTVSRYHGGNFEGALDAFKTMRAAPGFITLLAVAALVRLERIEEAREMLREFMRECEADMKEIPCDIEAWIEYTQQNYPFVDLQINRDLVDTLVEAGLDEFFVTGDAQPRGVLLPSILVLPFANLSGDPEQEYFSDGITAGLILALGHFEGIVIKSQQTGFAFKNSDLSSSEIAEKIDADFLVEGTIRKSAQRVRLSVQLIEAQGGSQIWGHQYDEELEDILELEQKLSQALAATIHGRLGHRIQQSAARKPAKDLKSYDHLMRGLYHFGKFTAKDMALAREEIEKCLAGDPENVLAHTNLAEAYVLELIENWAEDGAVTEAKARHHFETALELDPDSSLAHAYYADFLDFLRESEKTWFHADRAIEINPNSAEGHAVRTHLLSCERRHEEALHSADVCLQLDPYSVGSNWAAGVAYRNAGRYAEAIRVFRRIPHPPPTINAYVAGCFVAMGLVDEARAEMQRFLQISRRQMLSLPANADAWREYWRGRALFRHPEDYEKFFTQLLEAGLCDEAEDEASAVPSIAVLPFENLSGDPEQEHFADGITADLVDTLSRFAHLRTVSRYSTLQYKTDRPSIGDIAQQQQVRYILEGSVRRSGGKIRVNAELIDSRDGKILWSERYDRDLDDLFAVQDELTQSIALAMKVQLDDGEMARIRSRGATSIKAWELTMAAVDLQDTYIRQNLLEARKLASEATRVDPDYAYAWISLGYTHWQEVYSGWEVSVEDSIAEAEKALARAREIEPEYSEAYGLSGMIQLMKHDTEAAIRDCLRAVELEPGNAEIQALAAFTHVFAGEYEKGRSYERQVRRLCPVRANWYFLIDAQIEVASGNFERAAELYHDGIAVEPESPLCRFFLVDLMLRTGDEKAARGYADEIRALDAKVSGRGIVLTYSADPALRRTFHDHLAKFDLV